MSKKDIQEFEGIVTEALPDTKFRVKLKESEKEIIAYLSGKMRMNYIRVVPGDEVVVAMTPYDKDRGRIVYRL